MNKMLLRMPQYCRDFCCSAGACSDSCCIGWEIDIDEKTASYYKTVGGTFGDRLTENISRGEVSSFILKNERCPFLNENNLCDIILTLGEDKLCHICAEHPRYYEWFDGIKEGGVGLCCEEAARLILENGDCKDFFELEIPFEEPEDYDGKLYAFLFEAREKIMNLLRDKALSLKECAAMLLAYSEELQSLIDNYKYDFVPEIKSVEGSKAGAPDTAAMLGIFASLEPIDEKWKPFIESLEEKSENYHYSGRYEDKLRNIGIYFIYRYFLKGVFDEEILSRVKLAVISMASLSVIFECTSADFGQCVIFAKNYSKEVEYSEENLEAICDMSYTERVFSTEALVKFLI